MDVYSQYRVQCDATTASGQPTSVILAIVELSETFSGADEAVGASVVGAGVVSGDPQDVVDGNAETVVELFNQSGGVVSVTLTLLAGKSIKQWRLLEKFGNPLNVELQGFDGVDWIALDRRENEVFLPGVVKVFSIYESSGNARFSDGAIATEVVLVRDDDGELQGVATLDALSGDYYLLSADRGPFEAMITRAGYRPLMGESVLAAEA